MQILVLLRTTKTNNQRMKKPDGDESGHIVSAIQSPESIHWQQRAGNFPMNVPLLLCENLQVIGQRLRVERGVEIDLLAPLSVDEPDPSGVLHCASASGPS